MKRSSSTNGRGGSSSRGKKSNTRSTNSGSSSGRSSASSSRSSSGRSASSSRSSTRSSSTSSPSSSKRSTPSARSTSSSRTSARGNSSNGRSTRAKSTVRTSRSKQRVPSNFTDDLQKVMIDGLKDIFYAEKLLYKALGKLTKAAESEKLKMAFLTHMKETEGQIVKLEKVFSIFGLRPVGKKCPAMDGLVKEAGESIEEFEKGPARDAALIMSSQKAEHYEIATYGSLRTFAEILGFDEVALIFDDILDQESNVDETLTNLAKTINEHAALVNEGAEMKEMVNA